MTAVSDETVNYIARYGGMCRDCADEDGICPRSGLPCADRGKAIRHVLEALSYGLEHGFIKSAALSAAPVGGPLRRIVLDTLNAVAPAVENLSVHQEQCDRDGVMVKVSRQALDEVLNAVNEVAMQSAITASPDAPVAQEPVATKATQQASADFLHEEMIKLGSPLTYTACLTLTKRITDTNTLAWAGEVNKLCTEIGSLKNEIAALKSASTPPATSAGVGGG